MLSCWCLVADVLPAEADECKQKQKKPYLQWDADALHASWCAGALRADVRMCWLADALPADTDEDKQKQKLTWDGGCRHIACVHVGVWT